ncbi:MAG TPA: LOG family protein, partial [Phycisphaerae bacterium]|nr:LOG family protein [Phycisphaerae bacterium]
RKRKKVSVFGSARTKPSHPDYIAAMDFGRKIAQAGYMVITGAGGGIMHAAHDGAGKDSSFGVAIKLPFEQDVNPVILGNEKLAYFRYFFSRKIMFVKETHALALFPGGFGTHDEAFEVLTLIQTGRADPMPVVMIEYPGSNYWQSWDRFIREQLLASGLISPSDTVLWTITSDTSAAVNYITHFYSNYQSQRFVRNQLVLRIRRAPDQTQLQAINAEFADLCERGDITVATAAEVEPQEAPDIDLPRLVLQFNRQSSSRLRMLIDRLNDL